MLKKALIMGTITVAGIAIGYGISKYITKHVESVEIVIDPNKKEK